MIRAILTIERVLSTLGGGAIFTGVDETGRKWHVVVPYTLVSAPPGRGEIYEVAGDIKISDRHGEQLHAQEFSLARPRSALIVSYLANSPAMAGTGVGTVRARRLYETFGEALLDHLDQRDIDTLSQVIEREQAEALCDRWHKHQQETRVIGWLQRHQVDPKHARRVIRVWGVQAIERLTEDPYRLLLFYDWHSVDAIGKRLGIRADDPRRLIGAVEAALYARQDHRGHTLAPATALRGLVRERLGNHVYVQAAIDAAIATSVVVGDDEHGFQHVGVAALEHEAARRVGAMRAGVSLPQDGSQRSLEFVPDIDQVITTTLEQAQQRWGYRLTAEQHAAVRLACTQPLALVTGAAGVGKTTVLCAVHAVMENLGRPVYQCALAGRAAQRMRETTGRDAYTIARLVRAAQAETIRIEPGALLIVDEASMLDLGTAIRLLRLLPPGASLLMVGDPYQLPPINFGLVFHALCETEFVKAVELKQVHRQEASTGIPAVAQAIRQGRTSELPRDTNTGGVSFIDCPARDLLDKTLEVWNDLGSDPLDTMILSPTKAGPAGVHALNQELHYHRRHNKDCLSDSSIAVGDPVVHLTNNYERDLYNGSLGSVTDIKDDASGKELIVRWDDDETRNISEHESKTSISLAYALTVHKAQGSQFRRVIVPIGASRQLDRTLLYTAITRASEQVVMVGHRGAFEAAVTAPPRGQTRMVGLRNMLKVIASPAR